MPHEAGDNGNGEIVFIKDRPDRFDATVEHVGGSDHIRARLGVREGLSRQELDRFIVHSQERLWALARNLWWSWDHDSVGLFLDLDPVRWNELNHNPVSLLSEFPLAKLEARAGELMLHSRINYAYRRLLEYQEGERTWGGRHAGILRTRPVAYFSAEFGLHESLPVYSGGLGVLAGDHIKSASDLDIPLVGIGLFYGQGYFRQRLDTNGWQREEYLPTDVNHLPMEPAIGKDGAPVTVEVFTRTGSIRAKVWRVKVGRCDLLLLDSSVDRKPHGQLDVPTLQWLDATLASSPDKRRDRAP